MNPQQSHLSILQRAKSGLCLGSDPDFMGDTREKAASSRGSRADFDSKECFL